MEVSEYLLLKKEVEAIRNKIVREEGKRDELMSQLRERFAVTTVEEAENLRTELTKERDELEVSLEKSVREFKEKWDL